MSWKRVGALDVAQKHLFEASEGLSKAGRLLSEHGTPQDGLKEDGRTATGLAPVVEEMKNRVRKTREAVQAKMPRNESGGWV